MTVAPGATLTLDPDSHVVSARLTYKLGAFADITK